MINNSGKSAKQVPEKILLPIFEGMSLEDDEELSRCWAALLASAASQEASVRTAFSTILTELSGGDAIFLKQLYESDSKDQIKGLLGYTCVIAGKRNFSFPIGDVPINALEIGADTSYENLLRLGLIVEVNHSTDVRLALNSAF